MAGEMNRKAYTVKHHNKSLCIEKPEKVAAKQAYEASQMGDCCRVELYHKLSLSQSRSLPPWH